MKKSLLTLMILLLIVAMMPVDVHAGFVGVEWTGELWEIELDSSDPVGTKFGDIGPTGFNSMASGSDGTLYTILTASLPIDDAALFSIDPVTAEATLLHQFTMPPEPSPFTSAQISALAFNESNGLLYFVDAPVADGSGSPVISELYTLDPFSGNYTLVGSLGLGAATALAFDPNGILYGWVVGADGSGSGVGLVTIDIATGIATDVNPDVGGRSQDVQTLAFDSFGTLFGARDSVFEVDIATGVLMNEQVISNAVDIRGFEFITVPLSNSFVFLLTALGMVKLLSRRQRAFA